MNSVHIFDNFIKLGVLIFLLNIIFISIQGFELLLELLLSIWDVHTFPVECKEIR